MTCENCNCSSGSCGTGGWNGPKPGDPSNNSVLQATPAFGGIDVTWSYPTTNPAAVAHTLLYRGVSSSFTGAYQIAVVAGNQYYDKSTTSVNIQYYYWIKIVSVNGTEGELIGPVSATAKPVISSVIEGLTQQINSSHLAQSLKTEIDKITSNYTTLTQEIEDRIAANQAYSVALNYVQQQVDNTVAALYEETTFRQSGYNSLVDSISLLTTANTNAAAAIQEEKTLRISADSALSSSLTTVQSTVFGNTASGQVGLTTQVNTLDGKVTSIGAQYTAKVSVNGLVGGFGVYNDGTSVDAGFDVNTFWVGSTQANKRKPFIIKNGTTYIDDAVIEKLTFSKLRDESGSFIVENGKVKADYLNVLKIYGGSFTSYAWPTSGTGFYLGPEGLLLGNANTGKYFQVTSSGNIYAPNFSIIDGNATFSGTTYVNALSGDVNKIVAVSGDYGGQDIASDTWTTIGTAVLPASSHTSGHTPSAILTVYMFSGGGAKSGAIRLLINGVVVSESHTYINAISTLSIAGAAARTSAAATFTLQATGTSGHTIFVSQIRGYIMGVR